MTVMIETGRIGRAKRSFTTRRIPAEDMRVLLTGDATPSAGDLILARVETIGHHTKIEQPDGRRASLFPGDEIIVACGNRYAPDQFEAEIGNGLRPRHLVAAGGIAATAVSWNNRIAAPTEIAPVGRIGDRAGRPINLADYALAPRFGRPPIPVIAVAGTSMNAGKTTAAASLVRGLALAGHRVGAAKLTGTGAGGDLWSMHDAGAHRVVDFTDVGHASTYRADPAELLRSAATLLGYLAEEGVTVIVAEIADGLYQDETAALLQADAFRRLIDGIMFAAGDAMGAAAGVAWLHAASHHVLGISGLLTRSPLARREAAAATDVESFSPAQLSDPETAMNLLPLVARGIERAAG